MISRGILVLGDDSVIGEARSDRIPLSLSLRDTDNRGVKPSIRRIPSVSPFRAKRSIQARRERKTPFTERLDLSARNGGGVVTGPCRGPHTGLYHRVPRKLLVTRFPFVSRKKKKKKNI